MNNINILLNFEATDEYRENIQSQISANFVDSKVDEYIEVTKEVYIDWKYLVSTLGNSNIKFNFIEFYYKEVELDRYVFSGVEFHKKESSETIELPLVEYKSSVSKFNKVLFLDRDGIINIDTGYVYQFKEEIIHKDIFSLIKFCNNNAIKVAIVTNQAGVARGKYSISEVEEFHRELQELFKSNAIFFDHVEICPFHFEKGIAPWNFNSLLRKPNPGMLLRAASQLEASLRSSAMIGDKDSDRISLLGPEYFLLEGNYPIKSLNNVFSSRSQIFTATQDYLNKTLDFS